MQSIYTLTFITRKKIHTALSEKKNDIVVSRLKTSCCCPHGREMCGNVFVSYSPTFLLCIYVLFSFLSIAYFSPFSFSIFIISYSCRMLCFFLSLSLTLFLSQEKKALRHSLPFYNKIPFFYQSFSVFFCLGSFGIFVLLL